MQDSDISPDDLTDIIEMTDALEDYMCEVFEDVHLELAITAIVNATIHMLLCQCESQERAEQLRDLFFRIFDQAIEHTEFDEE